MVEYHRKPDYYAWGNVHYRAADDVTVISVVCATLDPMAVAMGAVSLNAS